MRASRWLGGLTRRLRDAGVVVPPSRLVDAARALEAIDLEPDFDLLRDALRVVLTQSRDDGRTFDRVFTRYMASHARAVTRRRAPRTPPGPAGEGHPTGTHAPPRSGDTIPISTPPPPRSGDTIPISTPPPPRSGDTIPNPPDRTPHPTPRPDEATRGYIRPHAATGGIIRPGARWEAPEAKQGAPEAKRGTPETKRGPQEDEGRRRERRGPTLDEALGDPALLSAWLASVAAEVEAEVEAAAPTGPADAAPPHPPQGPEAASPRPHRPSENRAAVPPGSPKSRRAAERATVRQALAPLESEGRVALPDLPLYSPLTPAEDALILDTVRRMARLMWIRRARRSRRWKSGRVSVKSTLAQSMRHGGVPFRIVRRKRRLRLARLLLLLDVSGSVRAAARFLLALAQALRRAFSSVRAFVFVDRPVEATVLLEVDPLPPLDRLDDVDWLGKSDFGNTFYKLLEEHHGLLTRDTLLVVLGDARNNRQDPMTWTLAQIRSRIGRLVWLNPEPRKRWGTADSAIHDYAPFCDALELCATTADLRRVADRWLHLAARWR